MKRRKWFSIAAMCLCTVMIVGLSACYNAPTSPTEKETEPAVTEASSATTAAPAPTTAKPKERYTFSIARQYNNPPSKDGIIKKYLEDKYDVNLDLWYIERASWGDSLAVRFASNEIPDYLYITAGTIQGQAASGFQVLSNYVDQEIVAEIDINTLKTAAPYIYNNVIREEKLKVLRYTSIGGKCYALPLVSSTIFHNAIVWRGDWLKKIGMDKYPEKFEDFEKAMYAFTNNDPDGNNIKDTYGMSQTGIPLVYGAFGYQPDRWMVRDGKLVHGSVQPEMKEALTVLNKWYNDGVIDPEFVTGENQGGYYAFSHPFMNNRLGLTCLGLFYHWKPLLYPGDSKSECYLEMQKVNPAAVTELQFGVPPTRNGIGGAPATASIIEQSFYGFGRHLEDDKDKFTALLQFLDALSSNYEGYLESIFGIKGTHWDFDKESGLPGFINDNSSKTVEEQGVCPGLESSEYTMKRAQPRFDWAFANNFDKGCMVNELIAPLPSEEKYKAELEKLREDTYTKIIRGDLPISYFDEYVEKWNSMGGAQLTKEANEWYDTVK